MVVQDWAFPAHAPAGKEAAVHSASKVIIKAQTFLPSRFQVSCPTMANKNLATESNTATGHKDDGQKRRTTSILKSRKSAWKIGELSFKDIIKLFTCVKSKCECLYVFSNVVFH